MNQSSFFGSEEEWLANMKSNWNKAIAGDGAFCPCCGQFGKVYKYKLSQHFALCLRWIAIHGKENGWVNVQNNAPRWILKAKTYPLLAHWKLIESQSNKSGIWRATHLGKMFVDGQISQPAYVYIYNNGVWGFDEQEVSFRGCFGRHFDFEELMSERFDWAKLREKPNEQ